MGKRDKESEEWDKTIRKIRDYAEEEYDKLIVYLNSGALVLTVGFVKDIVTITESTNTSLLKAAWILFTISLVLILVSHRTAIESMDCELVGKEKISDLWDIGTKVLNWFSLVTFIGGLISFLIFIYNTI